MRVEIILFNINLKLTKTTLAYVYYP